MRLIPLPKEKSARVDDADYDFLSQWRWLMNPAGYVVRYEDQRQVPMHRVILGAEPGKEVDHRDGDPLNNQRSNLRLCTHAENMKNRAAHRGSVSRFKGVYPDPRRSVWRAQIRSNGSKASLGTFTREEDAARAYDEAALRLHGDFARLNFPLCDSEPSAARPM